MKRLSLLCLPLALAMAPACGDDGGNGGPDARPLVDAMLTPDGMLPDAGADAGDDPDAMNGSDAAPPDAMLPLVGIGDARSAPDGAVDVSIEDVYVTYTKPAIGNDVAGFFVQLDQTGPALFVAVAPDTLTPEPAVGDIVSFTITEMGTAGMLRQATAISGLTVTSSGNDLSGLVQDVSAAADLVSAIGDYEAELITGTFTVTGAAATAGSGHMAAPIDSSAITANEDLLLRVPADLQDVYAFEADCVVTVTAVPMWRYNADAQVSVWEAGDFTATCPAPTVLAAVATSATTVELVFTRGIDATTITDPAAQFTFSGGAGLTASAAAVSGRTVTVTTGAQVEGESYTVTVASSIEDLLGAGVGTPNSSIFLGYGAPEAVCNDGLDDDIDGFVDCQDADCSANAQCAWAAQLYLWEVDADTTGSDVAEFIELRNMAAADVDLSDYYLVLLNGGATDDVSYRTIELTGTLATGALFIAGNAGVTAADVTFPDGTLQNGADGVLLVQCATCTGASDIPNGTDVGTAATFTVGAHTVTKIDGLAYDTADADDAVLMEKVGVVVQYDEAANGTKDTDSLQRTSLTSWIAAPPTAGDDASEL